MANSKSTNKNRPAGNLMTLGCQFLGCRTHCLLIPVRQHH